MINYDIQKGKIEDLVYVKDYYLSVLATEKLNNNFDEEWTLLHRQVCGYIKQWVDNNILNHVTGKKRARALQSKIEDH